MPGIIPTLLHRPLLAVLLTFGILSCSAAGQADVIQHKAGISFDLERHTVRITDRVGVPPGTSTVSSNGARDGRLPRGAANRLDREQHWSPR